MNKKVFLMNDRTRFMRVILFFDLPSTTSNDQKVYRKFHKYLIQNGYIMMQESVYSKLLMNYGASALEIERIRKNKPSKGLVQCLVITEKQYSGIINITGESKTDIVNNTKRVMFI